MPLLLSFSYFLFYHKIFILDTPRLFGREIHVERQSILNGETKENRGLRVVQQCCSRIPKRSLKPQTVIKCRCFLMKCAEYAEKYGKGHSSIIFWRKRFNGTIESLACRSRRPHSHPKPTESAFCSAFGAVLFSSPPPLSAAAENIDTFGFILYNKLDGMQYGDGKST